jgi:serine/threonine protein kinase
VGIVAHNALPTLAPSDREIKGTITPTNAEASHKTDQAAASVIKPAFEKALLKPASERTADVAHTNLSKAQNRTVATGTKNEVVYQKMDKNRPQAAVGDKVHTFATKKTKDPNDPTKKGEELGKGGFKIAFLETKESASANGTNNASAIKRLVFAKSKNTLANLSEPEKKSFLNEVKIQLSLKDKPQFLGIEHAFVYNGKKGEKVGLLMEFCDKGDAYTFLEKGKHEERMAHLPTVFQDALEGLAVLENRGIQHRDIKGHNIFMATDPQNPSQIRGKIADFGFAVEVSKHIATDDKGAPGTLDYMSPSYLKGKSMIDEGKRMLAEADQLEEKGKAEESKNPKLAAAMKKNASAIRNSGNKLIADGTPLYMDTRNDVWSAGMVLNEIHGYNPACIPIFINDPNNPGEKIVDPDFKFVEWTPYVEHNAKEVVKNMANAATDKINALKAEQNCIADKSSPEFKERQVQIDELRKEVTECRTAYTTNDNNNEATALLFSKASDTVEIYTTWMKLLSPEAMQAAKVMQMTGETDPTYVDLNSEEVQNLLAEESNSDDTKMTAFNYRMLNVDVKSQTSATDLANEFKTMKAEVDTHNEGKQTGLRSLFWLQSDKKADNT